jgi:lipopolysaccharide export system protein LptA
LRRIVQCALIALTALTLRTPLSPEAVLAAEAPGDESLQLPIRISGDVAHQWRTDDGANVSVIRENARVEQGDLTLHAKQLVVWQNHFQGRERIEVYLEGDVRIVRPDATRPKSTHFVELWTEAGTTFQARWPREYAGPLRSPLYERASERRRASSGAIRQTQLLELPPPGYYYTSRRFEETAGALRRFRIYTRTGQPISLKWERSTTTTPAEQIGIGTGGIKLNVDSPRADGLPDPNAIELAADNLVIWTADQDFSELTQGGEKLQARDTPLQVYLEGNIVIRQGDATLKADRAYYDARERRAILLDAELKMYVPQAESVVRVRAAEIRQLSERSFHARNAWLSGSYFGKPGYRLEASDIFLEPRVTNPWVKAQGGYIDPVTGEYEDGETDWVTSLDNRFVFGETPIFFAPYLAGPAEEPHIPITSVEVASDRPFGTQVKTAWDPFYLFSSESPEELSASLLIDYLSRRGPAGGFEGDYDGTEMFGPGDSYTGLFHGYYVNDSSTDRLGLDRLSLIPDDENRGRFLWRHRHRFPHSFSIFAESGYVSDRNFLEQYYENEFDQDKDNQTRLILEQKLQNLSWSLLAQPQLNEFENNSEWYPKADLFVLGEPLFGSPITWTSHSSAGYARRNQADAPNDPNDVFSPIGYYAGREGLVTMSRHELTLPFNVGPVIVVPFLMGEAARWGDDLMGDELERYVGSAGVRGSLTMWRAFPHICSRVFNLNGLAHRMVFDFEYAYTDSSEDITRIAQYNELDDDSQERFRQRFPVNTFGGVVPNFLNERRYAIRSGAGSLVSVPYHELIDDLNVFRVGWHHRLQTKVGPPHDMRIRDWMTLDLEASIFPNAGSHSLAGRDFGEDFGLLSARYSWLMSERTAFLANALYDTFDGGQQLWNVGLLTQRSARGSLYLGVRQVKAQSFKSQIATASASYLMSDKWVATGSTAHDISAGFNQGQTFTLTRIGADFLVHFGLGYDRSKESVGLAIALEPRFGPRTPYSSQMNSLLGLDQY